MVMSDFDIRGYIESGRLGISPLKSDTIRENGVDLRFSDEFRRLKRTEEVFDTRKLYTQDELREFYGDVERTKMFTLEPGDAILIKTKEYIKMPNDVMGFCNLRSSYARYGMNIPPTSINSGWEGNLVIAIEGGGFPVNLYKGERFLHVLFDKLLTSVGKGYDGIYQRQKTIQLPQPTLEK